MAALSAAALAIVALGFDTTHLMALMFPGRERVEVTATDGSIVVYACKPGPAGEAPADQADKAQLAFEDNVSKFTEALVAEMMADHVEDKPSLQEAFSIGMKMESWAGANWAHLEKQYGCALLG
jgi:hypothetical protein